MQTFFVTIIFGTLAIMFGICAASPFIFGLIHKRSFTVKTWHILGFVFSSYMLALEYNLVPNPVKKSEVQVINKIDTVYIYKDTASKKPLIPPYVPSLPWEIEKK